MNILPKKSWHVRNKDNIERVRRDEAQAAEEEKERQRRAALAESEARTDLLRAKSRKRKHSEETQAVEPCEEKQAVEPSTSSQGHVNFFEELEDGRKKDKKGNAEYEAEKKEEREKQEKALGLLTYLGQSALESQTEKPWYLKSSHRKSKDEKSETSKHRDEFNLKRKLALDPLQDMAKYVTEKEKSDQYQKGKDATYEKCRERDERHRRHKKHSHDSARHSSGSSSSSSAPSGSKTIQQLRAERLKREQAERQKAERLLAKLRGEKAPGDDQDRQGTDDKQRGYNSQYNPELARKYKSNRDYAPDRH